MEQVQDLNKRATILHSSPKESKNIETKFADRMQSLFAAFGQIISDFYIESGIYFVGGFNAALVAWGIYTDLIATNQPQLYAVTLAVIAFIAVEGLAVYLVGAAAKTGNGLLWFFAVLFAGFFTLAHYREMSQPGVIAQYIMLAVPFFVVIGYWARTIKLSLETEQAEAKDFERAKLAYQMEQARLNAEHKRALETKETELKHAEKIARLETKKVSHESVSQVSHKISDNKSLETLKPLIIDGVGDETTTMAQLARRLGVSRSTLYRHLGTLEKQGALHKNGNGYEVL